MKAKIIYFYTYKKIKTAGNVSAPPSKKKAPGRTSRVAL